MHMRLTTLALAAGLGLSVLSPTHAADITLKAGHINQPDSPLGLGFQKFADLVTEKSGGTMEVEIFPASQLGPIDTMFEDLGAGSLDVMIELLEWYGRWDKRYGVFGLPYLFRDRDHMQAFLATEEFKVDMIGALEERLNAKFLVEAITWDQRLDRTLLCKEPVFAPADLQGMKLRMFQSRIPVLSWETLGADIQIIPWAETYTALATGTVDCITARVEAHHAMRQTEVAKYITITKEYFQVYAPLISQVTADKLTDEQIAIIEEAAAEAGEWFSEYTASMQDEFETMVKDGDGVAIIEPPLGPWQDKIRPAYATFEAEGEIPEGIIDRVLAIQ